MRRWIGIGIVLIAIGIAGLLSPWSHWRDSWDTLKIDEQRSVAADGIKRIVVHTDSENVRLVYGNEDTVNIHIQGRASEGHWNDKNVVSTVKDGRLDIRANSTDMVVGINFYDISLTIEVPYQHEALDVKTDSGDIDMYRLKFDDTKLSTDSGDISLDGLVAENITVNTDSGDLMLVDTEGALTMKSDSGDLSWSGNQLVWPVSIKTDSGDVAYNLLQQPDNATIEYQSDSGDGVIEWGDQKLKTGSSLSEVYGNGAMAISVKTDSGDLNMNSK